ncbi:putative reticuline oxidase precursor [Zalerion maritima]|uniref:Reticuline oxidase n=1 Tax=Zalerion maritima TaxID=339359 RepID=A0AAD5WRC2_9PEZI|nr:putative reticuline oxidase precursor [Zalerion maritima]
MGKLAESNLAKTNTHTRLDHEANQTDPFRAHGGHQIVRVNTTTCDHWIWGMRPPVEPPEGSSEFTRTGLLSVHMKVTILVDSLLRSRISRLDGEAYSNPALPPWRVFSPTPRRTPRVARFNDKRPLTNASPKPKSLSVNLGRKPVAIAVPTAPQHVQDAVSCAAEAGIKATPKSGGHSYAAFSLGGGDGHLILELDRMDEVVLKDGGVTATMQAGAIRESNKPWDLSRVSIRSPACCIPVGAFAYGSKMYGLALDWITRVTVALANSSIVHCSSTSYPDLFWTVRGAGFSFGVVVEFDMARFEPSKRMVQLDFYAYGVPLDQGHPYNTMDLHGGKNSAVSFPPSHDSDIEPTSSYAHRDRLLLFQLYYSVYRRSYPEDGFGLLQGFVDSVAQDMEDQEWGVCVN